MKTISRTAAGCCLTIAFAVAAMGPLATPSPLLTRADADDGVSEKPRDDTPMPGRRIAAIEGPNVKAFVDGRTLRLVPDAVALENREFSMPRLSAPIRSLRWQAQSDSQPKIVPEPRRWLFSWDETPSANPVLTIALDAAPLLPEDCPIAGPAADGSVMLHAYQAETFGEKLRFEPQWYKNTVGYWTTATDYASWRFTTDQAGDYSVAVLQGCGKGQGGSEALLTLRRGEQVTAELPFRTTETGHFQNFRWFDLGNVHIDQAGEFQLRIEARRIAKAALFDVRMIHLVRQARSTGGIGRGE
jgi:hypothetical protein